MRSIVTLIFATMVISSVVSAQVPIVKHVFIVVEENEDFSCVIGNPAMKFLNEELAAKYGLAASYYANAHPSISNYFMLTTGQALFKNLHLLGDKRLRPVDADNVIRILKKNGKSWRAYVEDVKSRGYTGKDIITSEAHYVKRHNPLAYFEKDIPSADRANLAPFSQLTQDLNPAHLSLANYSFIVPNLLDDAHDVVGANGKSQTAKCGDPSALKQADDWLRTNVPPIISSPFFRDDGLLIVVFDEACHDDESDGAGSDEGGGRVPMIIVSSRVKPAYRSVALYHHESTLRLMLEALGLDSSNWPAAAKSAPSMAEFFH